MARKEQSLSCEEIIEKLTSITAPSMFHDYLNKNGASLSDGSTEDALLMIESMAKLFNDLSPRPSGNTSSQ